ncbi:MAG: hypothetical protein PSX80_11235 [bacterium]|nr:hypothetical protein [bacterium]
MKNTFSPFAQIGLFMIVIAMTGASSSAQFTIKIPKIPKMIKEKPQTPQSEDATPSPSSPSSSANTVSARASEIRGGAIISGAKVYFSTTPFSTSSAGAKSTFTSQEFIYGRLELNQSISEAFGLGKMPKRDYYYVRYKVFIGDEELGIGPNTGNPLYLSKDDVSKNFLNFDVLPDPNNVNTVLAVVDELWNYKFNASLVSEHTVRSTFPHNGSYPIRVVLFQPNFDDYGEIKFDSDPLPYTAGQFTFQYAASDWNAMNANQKKASENAETARNKRDTRKSLPDTWGKTKAPADPKLSAARITAMLNNYASQWGRAYLGRFAWDSYPLPIWNIQKDNIGLPSYRYAPHVWAIYKDNKDGMCYYGSHSIREDYSGAGTYGQAYLNTMGDRTYIDCAAVK